MFWRFLIFFQVKLLQIICKLFIYAGVFRKDEVKMCYIMLSSTKCIVFYIINCHRDLKQFSYCTFNWVAEKLNGVINLILLPVHRQKRLLFGKYSLLRETDSVEPEAIALNYCRQ